MSKYNITDEVFHKRDGNLTVIDKYYDGKYEEYNYLLSNYLWYLESDLN